MEKGRKPWTVYLLLRSHPLAEHIAAAPSILTVYASLQELDIIAYACGSLLHNASVRENPPTMWW